MGCLDKTFNKAEWMIGMKQYKRVALIGLDGSGKSANLDKMKEDVEYDEYQFLWVRWEPKLLGPAYWLLNKKIKRTDTMNEQGNISAEYGTKNSIKGKIFKIGIVRKTWLVLAITDYLIQFYRKTIKLLIKRKSVVFDRFFLDLFIDQGINFGYSPEKIEAEIKKYQSFFPEIDQYIYIRVSPEICYKRKDDIPNMEYLIKRYEIYEKLCSNEKWLIVDGEMPFEQVYSNIKEEILER